MTPQQFLTEFGHIASAPNGVQRLREMVLQLAVQGRLVEQRIEDGDVRLEIDESKAERKSYLTKIGGRSSKTDESMPLPEIPFAIPLNWCWIALGE
ncbi:MAG: restriction endonuclease subunit S, partial [Fibrobacterota bacterium]